MNQTTYPFALRQDKKLAKFLKLCYDMQSATTCRGAYHRASYSDKRESQILCIAAVYLRPFFCCSQGVRGMWLVGGGISS